VLKFSSSTGVDTIWIAATLKLAGLSAWFIVRTPVLGQLPERLPG
jgi:hypothetical protein